MFILVNINCVCFLGFPIHIAKVFCHLSLRASLVKLIHRFPFKCLRAKVLKGGEYARPQAESVLDWEGFVGFSGK